MSFLVRGLSEEEATVGKAESGETHDEDGEEREAAESEEADEEKQVALPGVNRALRA